VHDPAFRDFIIKLMLDVVRRYRVDGVNLDYIRSMGFCSSKHCQDDYQARYGRSLTLDTYLRKIPGKRIASLQTWNYDAVSAIVKNFSKEAKSARPKLVISVDAHPLNEDLLLQGQDSVMWANNGWIDVIFNMDYKKRTDVETAEAAAGQLHVPGKMTMLLSTFDKVDGKPILRDPALLVDYVRLVRRLWPDTGISFYQYPQFSDAQFTALKNEVFAETARPTWIRDR
jgi:uncharacterized lipoprotein YddW (UPF0748 family)